MTARGLVLPRSGPAADPVEAELPERLSPETEGALPAPGVRRVLPSVAGRVVLVEAT